MKLQYPEMANGQWNKFNIYEQMANIGTEVSRAIKWKEKKQVNNSQMAFYRALELLNLTKADPKHKNKGRLKEICRVYECLVDYFAGDNIYFSTDKAWEKYFYGFNWAARIDK